MCGTAKWVCVVDRYTRQRWTCLGPEAGGYAQRLGMGEECRVERRAGEGQAAGRLGAAGVLLCGGLGRDT